MDLFDELLHKRNHHARRHHGHHADRHHDEFIPVDHRDGWGGEHQPRQRVGEHMSHMAPLLRQVMENKTILVLLALLVLVLLAVAVTALVYLLPLIPKLLGFVGENGVKGVVDQILPILNKLWLGAGK